MNLGLANKPVIICAASAGLGKATAMEFAREGARIAICGRRPAELQRATDQIRAATGAEVLAVVADLTKREEIDRLVATTVASYGGVYALINNGGGPPAGSFEQFDDDAWQAAFELNLLSYVRVTRAVLPSFRRGGGGRVVNFTSGSMRGPIENLILSNTFRTGVMGLTKSLAGELGCEGILLNALGPGRIQTDRVDHLDQMRAHALKTTLAAVRKEASEKIPLGRYGAPEEFARVAVFLASPANTYLTGQALLVDGGLVKTY